MLQQLAAQHRGEICVGVGEAVLFGVEQVHVADKLVPIPAADCSAIHLAGRTVVAATHFAIAETGFERRRDLQIDTHLENAIVCTARRRDG